MSDKGVSAFRQHITDTLERREVALPIDIKLVPAGKLLYWILNRWKKPVISVRDVYLFAPSFIRQNLKEVQIQTEILAKRGWLVPLPTHRYDRKLWLIIRNAEEANTSHATEYRAATEQCAHGA